MIKFAYSNAKDASIGYILCKLNYIYHLSVFFKDETDLHLKSYSVTKLANKLKKLIEICCQNLFLVKKL